MKEGDYVSVLILQTRESIEHKDYRIHVRGNMYDFDIYSNPNKYINATIIEIIDNVEQTAAKIHGRLYPIEILYVGEETC